MMKTIRVVIQLDYDLDAWLEADEDLDPMAQAEDFVKNHLETYAYEDLTDLMRGSGLKSWAEVSIIDGGQN